MTNLREGLKCAKCRSLLATLGTYADGSNVWNLDQEQLPTFVQDAVDQVSTRTDSQNFDLLCQPPAFLVTQSGWTKGRLNCPSCQSRIGAFDFVGSGSTDHPVHLIKSKVD